MKELSHQDCHEPEQFICCLQMHGLPCIAYLHMISLLFYENFNIHSNNNNFNIQSNNNKDGLLHHGKFMIWMAYSMLNCYFSTSTLISEPPRNLIYE